MENIINNIEDVDDLDIDYENQSVKLDELRTLNGDGLKLGCSMFDDTNTKSVGSLCSCCKLTLRQVESIAAVKQCIKDGWCTTYEFDPVLDNSDYDINNDNCSEETLKSRKNACVFRNLQPAKYGLKQTRRRTCRFGWLYEMKFEIQYSEDSDF